MTPDLRGLDTRAVIRLNGATHAALAAAASAKAGGVAATAEAAFGLAARRKLTPKHRHAYNTYYKAIRAMNARTSHARAVPPLPVTLVTLAAFAMEYVMVRRCQASSLKKLAGMLRQYVTAHHGPTAWALSKDDWAKWTDIRTTIVKEHPPTPAGAPPISSRIMRALHRALCPHFSNLAVLQAWCIYTMMFHSMMRGIDVVRGNLWVEDVRYIPPRKGHQGGLEIAIFLDKNRKENTSASLTYIVPTDGRTDAITPLLEYCRRMDFDLTDPPPHQSLFPRLSHTGDVVAPYYTAETLRNRLRYHLKLAGVANPDSYGLAGFRPGGHTSMLINTGGNHQVSDSVARWDSRKSARRYDRRDADVWLFTMYTAGVGSSARQRQAAGGH